jgi:phosphatidylserine decarboxylase
MSTPHKSPTFPICLYGWTFWVPLALTGVLAMTVCFIAGLTWIGILFAVLTFVGIAFYRDFPRKIPQDRGLMVAPADGKVTEIVRLEYYEPFNGPALKIGIFLSVLDVHVNRSPCAGVILWTRYEEGLFLDARHPESGSKNQSNTLCLASPETDHPIAVVRQVVGAIARRIIAPVSKGDSLERGQRFGMIAFGSRTELYVPHPESWEQVVQLNQHVKGGSDVLLRRTHE